MNAKKFSDAMSELDTKYVDEALNYKTKMKKPIWIKWGIMAACLCLIICVVTIPRLLNGSNPPISGDLAPMVYVNNKLYQYTALGKINSDYISYILEDSSGIIWVATMNAGVSRFVPSEDLFQQVAADGVKNTITLFEDSRRNLWVGSSGNGLYLLEKKDKQLIQN